MTQKICRICMNESEENVFIFNTTENNMKTLAEMLTECNKYKVNKNDQIPKYVCRKCSTDVQSAYSFKEKVEHSYRQLYELFCKNDLGLAIPSKETSTVAEKGTQTERNSFDSNDLRKSEGNEYKASCQLCDKTFGLLSELRRHMLKEHTNENQAIKMSCPLCERTFSRKDHMKRHIIKIHKEDPNRYLIKRSGMKQVIDLHCPVCNRLFNRKDHLKRHIAVVHKANPNSFLNQSLIEIGNTEDQEKEVVTLNESQWNDEKHFAAKNPFASDSEIENDSNYLDMPVQTELDDAIIKQEPHEDFVMSKEEKQEKMNVKMEIPHFDAFEYDSNDNNEDHAGDTFDDSDNDYKEPEFLNEDFQADDADSNDNSEKKTKSNEDISKMLTVFAEEARPIFKKRHPRGDGTPEERTCQLCQRIFSRLCHLRRHMQSAHTQEKPHGCPHCEKRFTRSDHLKNHVQGVHAERTHKCDMCEKSFSRTEALQKHKEARHGDATGTYKIHECDFCQRKFTGKRYLARHRLLHTDRIFACRFCEETFKDRKVFREHERGHKSNERNFLCSICGDSFVRNDYLRIHMRRHLGEKPYKCQYCGKGFPRATDLKVHERYHTNTKPSVCSICGKAFHRAYNLTIHMRIHTGEKPYKCEHCPKSFAQSNDLKAHVRRHTGERYKCEQCDASFLQLYGLRQHALSAHGRLIESSTGRLQKVGAFNSSNIPELTIAPAAANVPISQSNGQQINIEKEHKTVELLNLSGTRTDSQDQHSSFPVSVAPTAPNMMPLIYPNVSAADIFKAQQQFMQLK